MSIESFHSYMQGTSQFSCVDTVGKFTVTGEDVGGFLCLSMIVPLISK